MQKVIFSKVVIGAATCGVFVSEVSKLPTLGKGSPRLQAWTDGLDVMVSTLLNDADAAWTALHLVGHCLQWSAYPHSRAEDLARERRPSSVAAARLYEATANRFALRVLRESGLSNLSRWFISRSESDWTSYAMWLANTIVGSPPRLFSVNAKAMEAFTTPSQTVEPGGVYEVAK